MVGAALQGRGLAGERRHPEKLRRRDQDLAVSGRRPIERSLFQALVKWTQALAVPVKHLDAIPHPPTEDEDMARQGIFLQHGLDLRR